MFVSGIGLVSALGCDTQSTWEAILRGETGVRSTSLWHHKGCFAKLLPSLDLRSAYRAEKGRRGATLKNLVTVPVAASLLAIKQIEIPQDGELGLYTGVNPSLPGAKGLLEDVPREKRILVDHGWSVGSTLLLTCPSKITGPVSCGIEGCCAGSYAIGGAYEQLKLGNAEHMLAGATETFTCSKFTASFCELGAMSRSTEVSRSIMPFDVNRQGTVFGEGAAWLLLSREESTNSIARIASFVRGTDSCDALFPEPEGTVLAKALQKALRIAQIDPSELGYVNVHGTGTPKNDTSEIAALRIALGDSFPNVYIGGTKQATGHLMMAAGPMEAAITCLALRDQVIPPHLNLHVLDPSFQGLRVPPTSSAIDHRFKYAASINLGFGGVYSILVFARCE